MKRFGEECKFIINFLKVTNKKLTIQEPTMHGRLKELVEGTLNRGPERWCAMIVMAMAALDAFVCEDVCNAIVIVFTEEESHVVNGERKKGTNQERKMGQ
jgi:hypothetical protein